MNFVIGHIYRRSNTCINRLAYHGVFCIEVSLVGLFTILHYGGTQEHNRNISDYHLAGLNIFLGLVPMDLGFGPPMSF